MSEHQLPSDPEQRKKLASMIKECVIVKQKADDITAGLKDTKATIAKDFDIPVKLINKLVSVAYKSNFEEVQHDNELFEIFYETLMRGKEVQE